MFESLLQEIVTGEKLWPDQDQKWDLRRTRIDPARMDEFTVRLNTLIAEFWGGPEQAWQRDQQGAGHR